MPAVMPKLLVLVSMAPLSGLAAEVSLVTGALTAVADLFTGVPGFCTVAS